MTEEQKDQNNTPAPLDSLKNEISSKLNDQNRKSISWNSTTITVVLAVLTFVALGQTVASISIFRKLSGSDVNASTGVPQNNSLEALPDMVGGC